MIDRGLAEQALLLLQAGQTQRAVHRQTGISRACIATLADGTWPGFQRDEIDPRPSNPPTRCGGCGAIVCPPCVACEAASHLESTPPRPPAPETEPEPVVFLHPTAQARYEEIHAFKQAHDPRKGVDPCDLS